MRQLEPSQYKKTAASPNGQKQSVEQALEDAELRVDRSVFVPDGEKYPTVTDHTDPSNQSKPTEIDGNCSLHTGDGLVVVDIDDRDKFPEEVEQNLPPTFTVETPHGGTHRYYHVTDDDGICTASPGWGDLQYDGVCVVCPGSYVDHSRCERDKDGCPGEGTDGYVVTEVRPIAALTEEENGDLLEAFRDLGSETPTNRSSSLSTASPQEINLPDEEVSEDLEWLCSEFLTSKAGKAASEALMDVLKGGTGGINELRRDDGMGVDRSEAMYWALYRLYGAFKHRGYDEDKAKDSALNVFAHFCLENPYTKTGDKRKWLERGDGYLRDRLDEAVHDFEPGEWARKVRWEYNDDNEGLERLSGKPGVVDQDIVVAAIHLLSTGIDIDLDELMMKYIVDVEEVEDDVVSACLPPAHTAEGSTKREYPTSEEVAKLAVELSPEDRTEGYFKRRVLSHIIQNTDRVVMSICWQRQADTHVYHLNDAEFTKPEDADEVRINGRDFEADEVSSGIEINPWTKQPIDAD